MIMKKRIIQLVFSLLIAGSVSAQYPLVPIDSIQFMSPTRLSQVQFGVAGQDNTLPDYIEPTFKNPTFGDTVIVEGVVVYDPISYGLSTSREAAWIQRPGTGDWAGIQIMYDSGAVPVNQNVVQFKQNMKKGRTVRVTGVIRHFQGETQLTVINVPVQVVSLGPTAITPKVVKVEDLMQNISGTQTPQFVTGEPLEGMYVEIQNVICYNPAPGSGPRYQWSVQDANGNRLPIRDVSGYFRNDDLDDDPNTPVPYAPPANGAIIPSIRGIITEAGNGGFKTYYIAPLLPSDVATPVEPPSIANVYRTPAQATSSDQVKIRAEITDKGTVTSTTLYYADYNSSTFTQVTMNNIGGDWYEGTIPAFPNNSFVKYYIGAVDDDGFTAYAPDSIADNSAYRVVDQITSIKQLQETPFPNGASPFAYDTLSNIAIKGLVVSGIQDHDLGVIAVQSEAGPWGTIFVRFTTGDGIISWRRGDSVMINKGIVTERIPLSSNPFGRTSNTGVTYLEEIGENGWSFISRCNPDATPYMLPFDSLMSTTFDKEPYENLLLELNDVWVVQKNADSVIGSNFGEFAVNPDVNAPTGFRADDYANDLYVNRVSDSLNQNGLDFLPVFRGVLVNTFGNWKFLPRNRTDMSKAGNVIPPYLTLIGADTLFILRGENINDPGAEVCDDELGSAITVDIDSSGVDINTLGTYEIFYNAEDPSGNEAEELNRYVVVTQGSSAKGPDDLKLVLYPVPASNSLNIRVDGAEAGTWNIRLVDMQGKTVLVQKAESDGSGLNQQVGLSAVKPGLYLCQISRNGVVMTEKVSVLR